MLIFQKKIVGEPIMTPGVLPGLLIEAHSALAEGVTARRYFVYASFPKQSLIQFEVQYMYSQDLEQLQLSPLTKHVYHQLLSSARTPQAQISRRRLVF